MYWATTHKHIRQLEICVDELSHHTFQVSDQNFLDTLGISNQTSWLQKQPSKNAMIMM